MSEVESARDLWTVTYIVTSTPTHILQPELLPSLASNQFVNEAKLSSAWTHAYI